MDKRAELEGFYMNNVKYIKCPAAQGAAIMNRQNKNSYLLGKFGLKCKGDFEQPRDWIFADREEEISDFAVTPSKRSGSPRESSPIENTRISPARTAEQSTKFRCGKNWSSGVFHKLRVCIVDVQDKRKPEFKKIIEANGGKAILDLSRNKVDILLVPHASGMNFKNATLWGVACIHPDWIEKSIEAGTLLALEKYRLVQESENLPPPDKKGSINKMKISKARVSMSNDQVTVGCFKLCLEGEAVTNSKTFVVAKSKMNTKTSNKVTPRITNDAFNASTRL